MPASLHASLRQLRALGEWGWEWGGDSLVQGFGAWVGFAKMLLLYASDLCVSLRRLRASGEAPTWVGWCRLPFQGGWCVDMRLLYAQCVFARARSGQKVRVSHPLSVSGVEVACLCWGLVLSCSCCCRR